MKQNNNKTNFFERLRYKIKNFFENLKENINMSRNKVEYDEKGMRVIHPKYERPENESTTRKKMKILKSKDNQEIKIRKLCQLCKKSQRIIEVVTDMGVMKFQMSGQNIDIFYAPFKNEPDYKAMEYKHIGGIVYVTDTKKVLTEFLDTAIYRFYAGEQVDFSKERPDSNWKFTEEKLDVGKFGINEVRIKDQDALNKAILHGDKATVSKLVDEAIYDAMKKDEEQELGISAYDKIDVSEINIKSQEKPISTFQNIMNNNNLVDQPSSYCKEDDLER